MNNTSKKSVQEHGPMVNAETSSQPMHDRRFEEFWQEYPVKKNKQQALRSWKRRRLDRKADDVIAGVREKLNTDNSWQQGYIPSGGRYIREKLYEEAPQSRPAEQSNRDAPTHKSYSDLLKDSRWQKKRLEVMERDDWTCQSCGASGEDVTLNVHHAYYEKGLRPWEYPTESLVTWCEECHEYRTKMMKDIQMALTQVDMESMKGTRNVLCLCETETMFRSLQKLVRQLLENQ